jgi:hypothetical protein
MVNDRTYRLGESPSFRMRIRQSATNPAIIFESSFLLVTQEFSFIKTADSSMTNGIRMNVWLENRGTEQMAAGFRFLLDTNLGEGSGLVPYFIGQQAVSSEFIIDSQREDPHWISRNNRFGLMGSVSTGEGPRPDVIHFANWKRLSEVSWKLAFIPNRNYNYLPYSINDSAVSYVFDPQPLARGGSRKYVIFLAMMDENGFLQAENSLNSYSFIPDNYTMGSSREEDLIILRDLITRLEDHLAGRIILSEGELAEIESAITGLKARYGLR